MTEPNLYNVGYDVGFEDGFREAQARVLDDLGDDPEIMAASRAEWAARAKAAEAKLAKAIKTLEFYGDERNYEGEYYADPCGCCGSWYEPKIHKDGQDSGGYARTTLEQLTGGNDE